VASEVAREDEIGVGWKIGVFAGLAVLALGWAPFWGTEHISLSALWGDADRTAVDILWQLRIPRVLMAFLAGAAMATGGVVLQAVFRNPLVSPFTLGTSSGAALGASLAIQFGCTFTWQGVSGVSLSAVVGAALSMALVYAITARGRQGPSTTALPLAGAGVCLVFSTLILLLQYAGPPLADGVRSLRMLRWTLGGFDGIESVVQFRDVWGALPFVAAGCLIVWYLLHELNLLSAGEEFAFSRGVNAGQIKLALLFGVALMVGGVVAVCGPIGFVGLLAPDACRRIVGPDHRRLYPSAWLFGGTLLVLCDAAVRTLTAPTELPVGIITALLGGPFFLWLLMARRRDGP
jgi:iron complex transport system permease protein